MRLAAPVLVMAAVGLWQGVRMPPLRVSLPRRRATDAPRAFLRAVAALDDELRAGSTISAAVAVARAVVGGGDDFGGDDFEWLNSAASKHDLPELRYLGVAVDLARTSGASLDETLLHVTESFEARLADRELVAQELASTKATIVLLSCLPVVGAAMAAMLGAGSIDWLVRTGPGHACAVAGLALEALGVVWVRRLVRGAVS